MRHLARKGPRPSYQQGQAALITVLLIIGVGAGALIYNFVSPAKQSIERDRITAAALAEAKAALIGYAVGIRLDVGGTPRIGDLPCPDMTNTGTAGGACSNAGGTTLGRLPWKTLGLPDLRDGYGERLWYAVSENFKNNPSSGVLNSDSRGTITVRNRNGTIVNDGTNPDPYVPSGAVAVIIAPGGILKREGAGAAQDRSSAGELLPVNYLDVATGEDNAQFLDGATNGFINGDVLDASGNIIVNDRILAITYEDILPLMERRVAAEVLKCLTAYAAKPQNSGRYPWAAPVTDVTAPYSDSFNVRFGRVPDSPLSQSLLGIWAAVPIVNGLVQIACNLTPFLCMGSNWPTSPDCNFATGIWWSQWKEQVFYGVAPGYTPNVTIGVVSILPPILSVGGAPTPGCPDCLTVNPPSSTPDKQVIVMVAGKRLGGVSGGQPRTAAARQDASNYVEGGNDDGDNNYVKQSPTATFNDTVRYK